MRGAIHIDSNKINNERIFIPDLYPQIRRLPQILFCHPERSEAQSRMERLGSRDIERKAG